MINLYPKATKAVFIFALFSLTSLVVTAQCPAGSVAAQNNKTYSSGDVVCVANTFNGSITLNNGAILIINITGNFKGSINAKNGSEIQVQAGGTFQPSNANNFSGKLVNQGTAILGSGTGVATNAEFVNSGFLQFASGINVWGNHLKITNEPYGFMDFAANIQLPNGSELNNNGTLYTKNLTLSNNTDFNNRGKVYVIGNLSISGRVENSYHMLVKGTTTKQGNDSLINYHTMVFDGNAGFNGGVRNEGLLWATSGQTTFHNGSLVQNNPNALLRINSNSFYNNATIQGTGYFYSALVPVNSDGSIRGFNNSSRLTTNFNNTSITNNAWAPNNNIFLTSSPSFPVYDTLNYNGGWGNPAAPFGQANFLPIVLKDFSGILQGSQISLNWVTESEINGEYMVLQYSTDGVNFTDLQKYQSNGGSTTTRYQYIHAQPAAGSNYYRLKMVSMDEGIKYSSVVIIKTSANRQVANVKTFPNPFSGVLQIRFETKTNSQASVKMISANGTITAEKLVSQTGTGMQQVTFNTPSSLAPGIYFVEISTGSEVFRQKVMKL